MTSLDTGELIVELSGVTKAYGMPERATHALNGIDLFIERGQFVSVMGPSGSGKTTLLNLVAGLDVPDTGRIVFDGQDVLRLSDRDMSRMRLHKIGFVFQAFNLIPALTAAENVSWPLEFSGFPGAEVRRRTSDALARVGVVDRDRRFPGELSGGEQQRVAIARAIATRPILLLVDEPTGNLDSFTGRLILDLLREMNQCDGVTVLMVTHNVFAATYGDRTLEMRDGRIVRDVRTPAREDDPSTGSVREQ